MNWLTSLFKNMTCQHSWKYIYTKPDSTRTGMTVDRDIYKCLKCGRNKSMIEPRGWE